MKMSGPLFKEIMYDTLYLKTSFLIFREKLEWLVKSEKKDSWYGRDLVSFKALLGWTVQQPLFLQNVICFSITASHFGKSSLRFKIINQVEEWVNY